MRRPLILAATLAPFLVLAAVMLLVRQAGVRELAGLLLLVCSAVTLSVQAGVHWRLLHPTAVASRLAVILPPAAGWASMQLPFEQATAVQVAAFGLFWLYEHRVLGAGMLPQVYLSLRRQMTVGIIAALGLALMAPSLFPA